jgi:phage gpG-like protein
MISVKLNGVEDLQNAFKEAASSLAEQAKATVANVANAIAEEAKQNCKGKLADSIAVHLNDDGMGATISTTEPYAALVEYGAAIPAIHPDKAKVLHWVEDGKDVFSHSARAHENAPRPFLNPAFEANRQSLIDGLGIDE